MGVDISDLAVRHTITMESLAGKVVAVDAFNIIYQFLSSIRQEDGTPLMDSKGQITAHLSGLFYRNAKILENGIRPIYVFDGKPPLFKKKTTEERIKAKKEAEEKWKRALEEERMADARRFAQATSRLTGEMIEESKKLLNAMGIPVIQAPSEGEAQSAEMVRQGVAYASVSQDYDSLLFGSPLLVRNLSITGRRKVPRQDRYVLVEPEEIILDETLAALGITREQLVMMGLMIGTDFCEGIERVGPKTALKIIKGIKSLDELAVYVKTKYNKEFEADIQEVYDFFMKPPTMKVEKQKFGLVKSDEVRKILIDNHEFSPERIEGTLANIEKSAKEMGTQKRLDEWV
jgi:flap endonuclease-1